MTKTEFIKCVSRQSGVPQDTVRAVLNAMIDPDGVIVSCMIRGDRLVLPGFGCFHTFITKAHDRSHPGTQAPMHLGPQVRMQFKAGKPVIRALKEIAPEDEG